MGVPAGIGSGAIGTAVLAEGEKLDKSRMVAASSELASRDKSALLVS